MAERNAKVKLGVVPDGDPAKPLKAIAEASKTAKKEADKLKDSIKGLGVPAKDTATKLSDIFLGAKKNAQDAEARIDKVSDAIKRLGLNTKQVTDMARAMGREFKLSTDQINQALARAGQGSMARQGMLSRMGISMGGLTAGIGTAMVSSQLLQAHRAALSTDADAAINEDIARNGSTWQRMGAELSLPGYSHARDLLTSSAREEAARSMRRLEAARSSTERRSRETAEMIAANRDEDAIENSITARRTALMTRNLASNATGQARAQVMGFIGTAAGRNFLANSETTGGMATLGIAQNEAVNQATRQFAVNRHRGQQQEEGLLRAQDREMDPGGMTPGARADLARVRDRIVGSLEQQLQTIEQGRQADIQTANNAMQQARLMNQLTRARQQQLEGAAIQFGSMTHEQQGDVMTAAQTFRREGIGGLTPEQLQQLRGTGLFNQQLDEQAFARARNGAFDQLANLAGRNPADELRRTLAESRVQAEVTIAFDEARIARALETAMRQFDSRVEQIATRLDAARDRAREAARIAPLPPG